MPSYIQVLEDEDSEPIEVPCEDQDNSILLSTLTSLFPKASGLKYKNAETGITRGIRLSGGRLQPPDDGWAISSLYFCAFIKDNKRKMKAQSPKTPPSQQNELQSQRKESSNKKRKLTEEERARKEALREEERLRKEAIKEEERIRKEKERAQKEALRLEEKNRKEAQKEEERLRREALKDEERLRREALKDEERLRKEEEKAKKEEERLRKEALKEEEKQKANEKQEKQKNILRNFFIKKSSEDSNIRKSSSNIESTANGLFLPFDLGENQTLAQIVPESAKIRFNRQQLDRLLDNQDSNKLYFDSLKTVDYKPLNSNKLDRSRPEIIIESGLENEENQDSNNPKNFRLKHLQFHENTRPPYRGTYRKISSKVKPTQPFRKDTDLFDYELDSDDEWEEGGPGESLDGSDSDGSVKDDYEIDNEFFVPHGYLSDDENEENEDKTQKTVENDTKNSDIEQKQLKCRPLLKEQVLMAERNRSFSSSLIPIVLGCVWESNPINNKSIEMLKSFKRVMISTK